MVAINGVHLMERGLNFLSAYGRPCGRVFHRSSPSLKNTCRTRSNDEPNDSGNLRTQRISTVGRAQRTMAAIVLLLAGTTVVYAQGAGVEWDILNQEVMELHRQGKYERAVVVAQKALEVAESNVGSDHPDVATSLNNLALLYQAQGEYANAEPLLKRSLAILKKALGPDHPDVALSLNNLAALYKTQGEYAKAEPLYKRSLAIQKKALGPDHPDVATALENLAALYRATNQDKEALELDKRAERIRAIQR